MRSTLARHIKPVNNGWATIHNFGVPAGGPLKPGFGLSGDVQILNEKSGFGAAGGPSFRAFAKRWDSVWLRASSDLLSCAGSQNPKKFAVGILTLAKNARMGSTPRLRSKSKVKVKVKVKGDGQECPSYRGKIKIPVPVSRNEGRDKDGAPDKTNH
jgi:hypothetical protein